MFSVLLLALACAPDPDDSGSIDTDPTLDDTGVDTDDTDPVDTDDTGVDTDDTDDIDETDTVDTDETYDTDCDLVTFRDADGDGYGDPTDTGTCDGTPGYVFQDGDCDDADAAVNPDAVDACGDGLDADCDGLDRSCVLYGDVTSSDATVTLTGASGAGLGSTMEVAPDWNDDGVDEIVVGSIYDTTFGTDAGQILVLEGMPTSGAAVGQEAWSVSGSAGDYVGQFLGVVPDMDGDGTWDLVACTTATAEAWVFTGMTPGAWTTGDASATVTGGSGLSYFGSWCGSAGDVNGDGRGDVAVRVGYNADRVEEVFVFDGATVGGSMAADDALLHIAGTYNSIGNTPLEPVGDVDGDGITDLVVAMRGAQGALFLGGLSGELDIDDAEARYTAERGTAATGEAVGAGGDLDGDGVDDVVLAQVTSARGVSYGGAVFVVSGTRRGTIGLDDADAILVGSVEQDGLGSTLLVRDLDGDGLAELVTGADQSHAGGSGLGGAAWVFRGPLSGALSTADASDALLGEGYGTYFGDVLSAGNLDGTGADDLVSSASFASGLDGRAWIFAAP